jgi:hypothetical protein
MIERRPVKPTICAFSEGEYFEDHAQYDDGKRFVSKRLGMIDTQNQEAL